MEVNLKAILINGRLIIESTSEESSIALEKWIKDNEYAFDKRLDIEIKAL